MILLSTVTDFKFNTVDKLLSGYGLKLVNLLIVALQGPSFGASEGPKTLICLFVLRLNIPVNNFSVMSGWRQRFLGLTSTVGS